MFLKERLTGKPHVDHGKRKRIKHLIKPKAEELVLNMVFKIGWRNKRKTSLY